MILLGFALISGAHLALGKEFKEAGGQLSRDDTSSPDPHSGGGMATLGAGATGCRKPPVSPGGQAWPGGERAAGRLPSPILSDFVVLFVRKGPIMPFTLLST